jgi:uncharacterized protein (TIGR01244 family)
VRLDRIPLCAFALALVALAGCSTQDQPEPKAPAADKLEPAVCGTIPNLHTLGGVFLAGQPNQPDFAVARKRGVKTVISLRHASELKDFDEKKAVEAEGMRFIELPFHGPAELTDAVFDRARELLKTAERPLLFHCNSANRAAAVWLPYRVLDGGLTWDEALAEAKTVGLTSPELEKRAREYVESRRK